MDKKEKSKKRKKVLGIKSEMQSWSEDFYPKSNKPFSNVQSLEIKINTREIRKVKNQISLIIRSTCKTDLDKNITDLLKNTSHDFSIVMTISEKTNVELEDFDLYEELYNCNDLSIIAGLDIEPDIEQNAIIDDL